LWSQRVSNPPPANLNQLLYDATAMAEPEDVITLLAKGAMIVPIGERMDTALHLAARRGFAVKLEALASVESTVNIEDKYNRAPIAFAALKGHHECVQVLLKHPKKPAYDLSKLLGEAVNEGQSKSVDALLGYLLERRGMERCEKFGDLIESAVKAENKAMIEVFMTRGFPLNGGRVVYKTENGKVPFTQYDNNPDKTRLRGYVSNPLLTAIKQRSKEMVEWLVEKGASIEIPVFVPDRKGGDMTILDYAKMEGTPEIVEYLQGKLSPQPRQFTYIGNKPIQVD
jgi:ankyrin repeat protein